MNKAVYADYVRAGETKMPMSPEDLELRRKVRTIGRYIQKMSNEDSGWKGGVKSTSYCHKLEHVEWRGWDADCESMYTLTAHSQTVARCYDCYGQGFFEYINSKTIEKLYNLLPESARQ